MLATFIFLFAVAASVLVVVLLALFSPVPGNDPSETLLSFSLYVQQPHIPVTSYHHHYHHQGTLSSSDGVGALIFHRTLTERPENTSRVVGKAQGFIIPHEQFANSDFNVIYLTFETAEYSGSLSVQAKGMEHKDVEILNVVGGTGAFAFARGVALFAQTDDDVVATYRVKIQLWFPDRFHSCPGR